MSPDVTSSTVVAPTSTSSTGPVVGTADLASVVVAPDELRDRLGEWSQRFARALARDAAADAGGFRPDPVG